jgi:glycine hydroxymethyltransferase
VTSRGFKEDDMKEIAKLIDMTVESYEEKKEEIRNRVAVVCKKYPLY